MDLKEIVMQGAEAHANGASWSSGGDYVYGSAQETAWRTGWEIACAQRIMDGQELATNMPQGAIIQQGRFGREWWNK